MLDDPANGGQWSVGSSVSPVMVLVDAAGKIRYMGPAGGFLPRMLLALELPKATGGGPSGAMPTMPTGAAGVPRNRGLWVRCRGAPGRQVQPERMPERVMWGAME